MGESTQQKASSDIYRDIGNINANVPNLFSGYNDPYSVESILGAADKYTDTAVGNIRKGIKSDINTAGSRVGSRFAGQGVTGGAILEDALSRSENNIRKIGQGNIESLQESRLALTPDILNQGNQSAFRNRSAEQSVAFQKLRALFDKIGLRMGAAQGLDNDTWFDDLLSIANTAGGFVPLFSKGK